MRETHGNEIPQGAKQIKTKMTNCVHWQGKGEHSFVTMRGSSSEVLTSQLGEKTRDIIEKGFLEIDPFKSYFEHFSFFVDLYEHSDKPGDMIKYEAKDISKCGSHATGYIFLIKKGLYVPSNPGGRTNPGFASGKTVYIYPYIFLFFFGSENMRYDAFPLMVMHELGHSFAGLTDEYYKGLNLLLGSANIFLSTPNCKFFPEKSYLLNSILYGETSFSTCQFFPDGYRPSDKSIMNNLIATGRAAGGRFNVISCGYVISAIKGGNAKSYWPECLRLDTDKPDCAMNGCPEGFKCVDDRENPLSAFDNRGRPIDYALCVKS
jgi:hypothetical protein